tara:strand:+ start:10686 stop:11483 length:798 start_codon:yes stop_codon:yes gene_type:complete
MIKKISLALASLVLILLSYLIFLLDINDYKDNFENIISKKANIELTIDGDLNLDLGINTNISAEKLKIKKNNILLIESDEFQASVSLSEIINGIFDINSISLKNSKLYGINIDETIIQTYNAIAGRRYTMKNSQYSNIELIEARGYFKENFLYVDNIKILTELLEGEGFGKINPSNESINISSNTIIRKNKEVREKYSSFYPVYLVDTQLPVMITGNYTNPDIDIKISEIVAKKLKEEIKNRAIETIKEKLKDKIQSDINIKLPF